MAAREPDSVERQHLRFLLLYAVAFAGGAVAYVPFLTLILPVQATAIAGDAGALRLLAYAAFTGALTASIANIAFGWLSDRIGARRPLIAVGLVTSCALMAVMPMAMSATALIATIIAWQVALNMMLAPLGAWAGDQVPDAQKGMLGGLLAFAPALGALAGVIVTLPMFDADGDRHRAVAALVLLMVGPGLILARPRAMVHLAPALHVGPATPTSRRGPRVVATMWLARLLVQIAEASLFAFLLLWFRSIEPGFAAHGAAMIFTLVLCSAVVVALVIGRWSDRARRPILPLSVTAGLAALGLLAMAAARTLPMALAGYAVFGLASTVFLALHAGQTLRVLPAARRRGRDLGLFNLTNTVPSLVMPWLTLALVPHYGFGALFMLLAMLAGAASLLLAMLARREDQAGRRA